MLNRKRIVDAVLYANIEWLVRQYGFVVRIGEKISGPKFADRILSTFDRDLAQAKVAAHTARKKVVSIEHKCGDVTIVEWRDVK